MSTNEFKFDGDLHLGSGVLSVTDTGTVETIVDFVSVTNKANADSMTDTGTGLLFNQYYHDNTTPALVNAGRLAILTEGNWLSSAATQASSMTFSTTIGGTLTERMRLTSQGRLGIRTTDPSAYLDIEAPGSAIALYDFIEITNTANLASMTGAGTAILFNQWYYDAVTPAVDEAGRIAIVTESNWRAPGGATQNSCMVFYTALADTVAEKWRISSTGSLSNTGSTGTAYLTLKAGTATVNTAPIKLTTGTLLTTRESGAIEFLTDTLYFSNSLRHSLDGTLYTQVTNKTVSNTASETTLVDTTSAKSDAIVSAEIKLPADYLSVGKSLYVMASGYYSTLSENPGNLTLRIKIGTTTVLSTGSVALTANLTSRGWYVDGVITCRAVGDAVTGFVFSQGKAALSISASDSVLWDMENTDHSHVDTTATEKVDLTAEFTSADASNSITCTNLLVKALN